MKLFTRYMARRFIEPFLAGLGLFALLIFLGDLFNRMGALVKSPAHLTTIIQYLWLEVPYWGIRVIPMATLLATLIALTGFVRSGEWIAVQACGFKTKEFWKPLLWCALGVTLFSFAAQETILPACYRRAERLWRDQIHPEWEWDQYGNIAIVGGPGEFLEARLFRPKEGRMDRPLLEHVSGGQVASQLDARYALWDEASGRWVFHDGVERDFSGLKAREEPFSSRVSDLAVPPRRLIPRERNPDEMSLRELLAYSRGVRRLGLPTLHLSVAAHRKLSYPFANLIICALGIPVALRLGRAGKPVAFFTALSVSFLYLWVIELSCALGDGGVLPPAVAAWAPNLFFGACAALLLSRFQD